MEVRGSEEQVKIMGHVLEKISQNLMTDFGVDHYCNPNSVTSAAAASTNQQIKKAKL